MTDGTLKNLPKGPSDAPERKINCRAPISTAEWRASLISIKLLPRRDRLWFWPLEFEGYAMRDGFPHGVAIGLGLAFAFALSLLVFIAWGGHLHW